MSIACALDREKFEERRALLAQLAKLATERSVIPGGMAFCFEPAAGLVGQLASFVELERACCPFFTFRIDVRAAGPVRLEWTGPPDAQPIQQDLISAA